MRVRAATRHDSRPPEVRRAAGVARSLAERAGEPFVATRDRSAQCCSGWHNQHSICLPVCGVEMLGHDAVHRALNVMGIQSVEGLSEWVSGQGFHNHDGVPIPAGVRKNDS